MRNTCMLSLLLSIIFLLSSCGGSGDSDSVVFASIDDLFVHPMRVESNGSYEGVWLFLETRATEDDAASISLARRQYIARFGAEDVTVSDDEAMRFSLELDSCDRFSVTELDIDNSGESQVNDVDELVPGFFEISTMIDAQFSNFTELRGVVRSEVLLADNQSNSTFDVRAVKISHNTEDFIVQGDIALELVDNRTFEGAPSNRVNCYDYSRTESLVAQAEEEKSAVRIFLFAWHTSASL